MSLKSVAHFVGVALAVIVIATAVLVAVALLMSQAPPDTSPMCMLPAKDAPAWCFQQTRP